ncbi:hypothetical protein C7I55_07965 [Sphingomonas deserti]|uniref:Uncharacterized protein n=1 Tax=Allosphingosinicella deserti TaxID=2116704 RepID=A0A2P7QW08_9SPHN|nr:hypothetical protein C7I55_07965 [Sphingomonas deserti]
MPSRLSTLRGHGRVLLAGPATIISGLGPLKESGSPSPRKQTAIARSGRSRRGVGGLMRLTASPANDAYISWSSDGRWITLASARGGFSDEALLHPANPWPYGDIYVMGVGGSGAHAGPTIRSRRDRQPGACSRQRPSLFCSCLSGSRHDAVGGATEVSERARR